MTNRDYLRGLSNEKLARVLNELKIFDLDCNGDCYKMARGKKKTKS